MILESTKFDEITFCQAVERLKTGETVFAENGFEYKLEGGRVLSRDSRVLSRFSETGLIFSNAITSKWFIKKPFDVRQAMRDKPDEWVAAYENPCGQWFKIGFDTYYQSAVFAPLKVELPVSGDRAQTATVYIIDNSIPLDEVPADAR